MAQARLQLGVLVPLDAISVLESKERSLAIFEGFNAFGRSDLCTASKQISRKHISIQASANKPYHIAVEGQNAVVIRRGMERHELKSQRKFSLHVGDILELLPGKFPFKLVEVSHKASAEEVEEAKHHILAKRKRQEMEDECLARELQATEEESVKYSQITRSVEKAEKQGDNSTLDQLSARAFKLLQVRGLPKWANDGCVGIQDVINGQVLFALLSNYMVDFEWLLSACPLLQSIPHVVVVHGETGGSLERLKAEKPTKWLLHKPPLPISYGTHHSKAMILIYEAGVRVIVHTANLIYVDWNNKTQGLWMQDFPYKSEMEASVASPFEDDLVEYLEALKWSGCTAVLPNHGKVQINAAFFKKFDYSSAKVRLIASVPGYHQGQSLKKWGHMKLRSILNQQFFEDEFIKSPLVYQFSSLGSLDEKWLAEFNISTSAGLAQRNIPLGLGNFQIIWPTVEDVRCSVEGYAAGNAVPSPLKNVEKQFLRKYWSRWHADHTGRSRAMPHFKSYVRYNNQRLAWFLLTSANLSKAAWGALQKNESQLMIRSYELGVVFLPSIWKPEGNFSCTNAKPNTFISTPCKDTNKKHSLSSKERDQVQDPGTRAKDIHGSHKFLTIENPSTMTAQDNAVVFPVPYRLPPERYSSEDIPWSWDRQYSKPDTYGEVWPRMVKLYGTKEV